jgi:hypothetical protein
MAAEIDTPLPGRQTRATSFPAATPPIAGCRSPYAGEGLVDDTPLSGIGQADDVGASDSVASMAERIGRLAKAISVPNESLQPTGASDDYRTLSDEELRDAPGRASSPSRPRAGRSSRGGAPSSSVVDSLARRQRRRLSMRRCPPLPHLWAIDVPSLG